jgi:hypothetical protein
MKIAVSNMDASARRRTTAAKLLSKDEARRIAANIAKLPRHRLKRGISTLA